ncbi:unnamed protein product [Anisakis simplex]|uniref:Nipped-B-like protein pqn-85 (inferred by orthology to a C. elegans protein) n=1 Tax=Anisakis simplex TaxID=6269 RepID=A0A0M3KEM4_ANISI|nr:unnamed protein product [Anisakis simplex]
MNLTGWGSIWPGGDRGVYIEDTIDRSIQLCKQFLQHIVYPSADVLCRSPSKARKADDKKRRKAHSQARALTLQKVYARITELVGCFAELVRTQPLTDTAVLHLCTVGCGPFFVDNTGELQLQAIKLLSAICARYEEFRTTIIQDLLNSLHRLPSTKNAKNSYRMSAEEWVGNLTVLVMQLVQSVVKIPRRRRSEESQHGTEREGGNGDEINSNSNSINNPDTVVKESFRQAQSMAKMFLSGFLGKSKSIDMSLRVACLDYLGTITARHRKDLQLAVSDEVRLDMVVKVLVFDELGEGEQPADVNAVDISHVRVYLFIIVIY